jgi:peptidoglycan/LPS O-acetylase OafA/YrhL
VFRLGHAGPVDNLVFAATAIILTIMLAGLTYRFIERPAIVFFGGLRERLFYAPRPAIQPANAA